MEENTEQNAWRIRMLLLHGAMLCAPMLFLVIHVGSYGQTLGICVFRSISGIDCPGCGITHSVMAMYRGHLGDALSIHPSGPAIVGLVGIMTSYLLAVLLSKYKGMEWRREIKTYGILDGLMGALLLSGWIVKMCIN